MEKKISKKKWKCKEIDVKSGKACKEVYKDRICPHLEALLPKTAKGRHAGPKLIYTDNIERYANKAATLSEQTLEEFEKKLKALNLEEEARELLVARFYYMMPFGMVAKELGYTSSAAAFYHYKKIIAKLRLKGVKGVALA